MTRERWCMATGRNMRTSAAAALVAALARIAAEAAERSVPLNGGSATPSKRRSRYVHVYNTCVKELETATPACGEPWLTKEMPE